LSQYRPWFNYSGTDPTEAAMIGENKKATEQANWPTRDDHEEEWLVLAVDDDSLYRKTTEFTLKNFQTLGRPIRLIQAGSYGEACAAVAQNPDIALILLDVVMDTDDAGFRVVRAIREVLGNAQVRIVMITGQPGFSSMQESLVDYDINDYWSKTELSVERLRAVVTANVRAYQHLATVHRARKGLQLIAESSNALSQARTLEDFSSRMLVAVAKLLGVHPEGIVCVGIPPGSAPKVIASAGSQAISNGKPLVNLDNHQIRMALLDVIQKKQSDFEKDYTVLFFPQQLAGAEYAAYVATGRRLRETEVQLLKVFVENLGRGLHNVSLVSKLDEMAYHDSLVDLPNANALIRGIESMLGRPGQTLLLLNIDGFSDLNLSLGSDAGDQLLQAVGKCLHEFVDPVVIKARLQDDIFALLGPDSHIDAAALEYLLEQAIEKIGIGPLSISTVTSDLAQPATNGVQVITRARLSLKLRRARGLRQHIRSDPEIGAAAQARFELLTAFQRALENEEITIALQPQLSLTTGKIVGAEALARWTTADGRFISPGEFIPLAETTGLIMRMGDQIIKRTLEAARQIEQVGLQAIRLGFNVSTIQLFQPGFLERLEHNIAESKVDASRLELEITESAAMKDFDQVIEVLAAIRNMGLQVAIDDFGTGFSSLAYLKRLPADRLKIDRAFVNEVGFDDSRLSIAENIIELAQKLSLSTIAEGVETEAQASWLKQRQCEEVQGFFYARPMPLSDFLQWVKEHQGA